MKNIYKKLPSERRGNSRFPTITIIKEVVIEVRHHTLRKRIILPAIMYNLSTGGIAIVTFDRVPVGAEITLNLKLAGINLKNVKGRVIRVEGKKMTFLIAISFKKLNKDIKKIISKVASDADLCETKILLGEKQACTFKCNYYDLCTNPMKKKAK